MNKITMEIVNFDEYQRDDTAIITIDESASIRVDYPSGHSIGEFDITISYGDGWVKIPTQHT